jgi:hypothetical protein
MFKEIEMGRLNFIESEAERVHGPLHGLPAPQDPGFDPHYGFPRPEATPSTKTPSTKKGRQVPRPPEPGIPPVPLEELEDSVPMPTTEGDYRSGAALMQGDDEEDLDAAFIQTNYRTPARGKSTVGRANAASAKPAAAAKVKKGAVKNTKKTKPKPEEDQARQRRSMPEES